MTPIEEIKSKLAIEQVIGEYISLKQSGMNWKGLCPFHQEKTPSFMVSQDKQIWHCFGCNEGGDVITFVQKYEGMEFREAAQLLAQKAGVVLTGFAVPDQSKKKQLQDINAAAEEYYVRELKGDSQAAKKTRDYLTSRGLTVETMQGWNLGLSPDSWEGLLAFLKEKKYPVVDMVAAGLVISREQKYYDRFRRRLMFPITDAQGNVVAFTARTLQYIAYDEEDAQGKYVNSPGTQLYNKSQVLYGFDKAKHAIKRAGYAIIVEGNMDAIMSHQAGVQNVVAVSGTALTPDQLKILKRYTENIILAFDSDSAGSQAVFRGVTLAWENDMNVKVIVLTEGKDPAEIIQKDPALWKEAIRTSIGVVDFYIDAIFKRVDLSRADHKKIAAQRIVGIINKLKTKIEQSHYVTLLAQKLQMPESVLQTMVQEPQAAAEPIAQETPWSDSKKGSAFYSEQLLSFILQYPDLGRAIVDEVEQEFLSEDTRDLYKKIILQYTKNQLLNFLELSSELSPDELRRWSELVFQGERNYGALLPEQRVHELERLRGLVLHAHYTNQLQELTEAIKRAEQAGDQSSVETLMHAYHALSKKRASR